MELTGSSLVQIIHASNVGLYPEKISDGDAEDLAHAFPKTATRGGSVKGLIQQDKFSVQLGACSIKHSLVGKSPVKGVKDLWTRLAASARDMNAVEHLRKASMHIYMYLFPWSDDVRTELGFCVFCPPRTGTIAAISQCEWHAPWYHAPQIREHEKMAQRLLESCEKLHQRIMAHSAMTDCLQCIGFVFDVMWSKIRAIRR